MNISMYIHIISSINDPGIAHPKVKHPRQPRYHCEKSRVHLRETWTWQYGAGCIAHPSPASTQNVAISNTLKR